MLIVVTVAILAQDTKMCTKANSRFCFPFRKNAAKVFPVQKFNKQIHTLSSNQKLEEELKRLHLGLKVSIMTVDEALKYYGMVNVGSTSCNPVQTVLDGVQTKQNTIAGAKADSFAVLGARTSAANQLPSTITYDELVKSVKDGTIWKIEVLSSMLAVVLSNLHCTKDVLAVPHGWYYMEDETCESYFGIKTYYTEASGFIRVYNPSSRKCFWAFVLKDAEVPEKLENGIFPQFLKSEIANDYKHVFNTFRETNIAQKRDKPMMLCASLTDMSFIRVNGEKEITLMVE